MDEIETQIKKIEHALRIDRLKSGNWQFGHAGRHRGIGSEECPREPHHHHDAFCDYPSTAELQEAGIDPDKFKNRSRMGGHF